MNSQNKKIIAPTVVAVFMMIYYGAFTAFLISTEMSPMIKIFSAVTAIAISFIIIKVLFERINEIKKGEEDDLSQY